MVGSLLFAMFAPIGLVYGIVTLDQRVKTESNWMAEWPVLLATIPPMETRYGVFSSMRFFMITVLIVFIGLYGAFSFLYLSGMIG